MIIYRMLSLEKTLVRYGLLQGVLSFPKRPWTQQKKMAAPCKRMASRAVIPILSQFRKTWSKNNVFCQGFSTSFCRQTLQTRNVIEKATSPWRLLAAVCLQRLPVISATCTPIEQQFKEMLQQVSRFIYFFHKRCNYYYYFIASCF